MRLVGGFLFFACSAATAVVQAQTIRTHVLFEFQPPSVLAKESPKTVDATLQVKKSIDYEPLSSAETHQVELSKGNYSYKHLLDQVSTTSLSPTSLLKAEVNVGVDAPVRPLPLDLVRPARTEEMIAKIVVRLRPSTEVFSDERRRVDQTIGHISSQTTPSPSPTNDAAITDALKLTADMLAYAEYRKDPAIWKSYYVVTLRALCGFASMASFEGWPSDVRDSLYALDENIGSIALLKDRVACILEVLKSPLAKLVKDDTRRKLLEALTQSPFDLKLSADQQVELLGEQLYALNRIGEVKQGMQLFRLSYSKLSDLYARNANEDSSRREKISQTAQKALELLLQLISEFYQSTTPKDAVTNFGSLREYNNMLRTFQRDIRS